MKKIKKKMKKKLKKILKKITKKNKFSNALSHHCTDAWVTRPERPKGVKNVIKQARSAATKKSGPGGTPRLLAYI